MQTGSSHQRCEFDLPNPQTARVMGLRNFGEIFNPQNLPFAVPPQIRLWQTFCSLCRAEFNSFYLTSISQSVPEILMRVKIGQNWNIPKFKNLLWKSSPFNFFSFQICVVARSRVSKALIAISQIFQILPLGAKYPFYKISKTVRDFSKILKEPTRVPRTMTFCNWDDIAAALAKGRKLDPKIEI